MIKRFRDERFSNIIIGEHVFLPGYFLLLFRLRDGENTNDQKRVF